MQDFSGDSAGMMWTRLLVGVGGSGLGLRASRDGLLRVAGAGCAGKQQQQRQASSAEVSAACSVAALVNFKVYQLQSAFALLLVKAAQSEVL